MTKEITIWILLALLFAGQFLLFFLFFKFFRKLDKKFNGANGKDILKLLADSMEKSEQVDRNLREFLKDAERDRAILRTTLHKVGFVRFNPFKGMGGSYSFSIALLDGDHNGFLITSLYGKDGVRTYAKEVREGISEQTMTQEEERALHQAMKKYAINRNEQKQ